MVDSAHIDSRPSTGSESSTPSCSDEASRTGQRESLLDLARQQRNLLLMRPLFQLEFNKHHYVSESGIRYFANIDTTYLCLQLLDFLMEGMAISMGRSATDATSHLAKIASVMDDDLAPQETARIAEIVFGVMTNAGENLREFECWHYDAAAQENRKFAFRLVQVAQDLEDTYCYQPSEYGYLLYLGMLDLSPEDSAELMEKMLQLLIERGRYDDALEIAKRARLISIEYRQLIRDKLNQANRAPLSVAWSKSMTPKLNESRVHVATRQREDARMIDAIQLQLRNADDYKMRQNLVNLLRTLRGSTEIRTVLAKDIIEAPERFLAAQKTAFRVRGQSSIPDLESALLPELLKKPVCELAIIAERAVPAFYSATIPKIFYLNDVVCSLLEKQGQDALSPELDAGELQPLEVSAPMFDANTIDESLNWLNKELMTTEVVTAEVLLERAQAFGFSDVHQLCMALMLYRSFPASDNLFPDVSATIGNGRFRVRVVEGSEIVFERCGDGGKSDVH